MTYARNTKIKELAADGMTPKMIGRHFGLSESRIKYIIKHFNPINPKLKK